MQARPLFVAALLAVTAVGAMADEFERGPTQAPAQTSVTRAQVKTQLVQFESHDHLVRADRAETGAFATHPAAVPSPTRAAVASQFNGAGSARQPWSASYRPGLDLVTQG